jgi:hypothetical protein
MNAPRMCPHCGTELIQPTFVYATMSVSFDGMPCEVSGLHAYRCDNAHFFLVFDEQRVLEQSDVGANGSSIFL